MKRNFIELFLLSILIFCCKGKQEESNSPYFGNGIHNGWADRNSIVIWTRLTKNKEGNSNGLKFLKTSKSEHKELAKNSDANYLLSSQLPENKILSQMEGACPGVSGEVKLSYYPENNLENKKVRNWVEVNTNRNYTKQWTLEDLNPGTKYVVEIEARFNSESIVSDKIKGFFKTAPNKNIKRDLDFCIVTCHDYIRKDSIMGHKIYNAMAKINPDFYVHTGDVEYYDKPDPYALTEELMYFKWDRLFALPLQRKFWSNTTSYFMKDDHDVLKNDAYQGESYGSVSWDRGLEIFEKDEFPSHKKYYKTVRWGKDLQIWITEGRKYRSKNTDEDGVDKTIFGKEQKEWLFRTLKESDATFKVVILADPILGPDRKNKNDNHANASFKTEGDEVRAFVNQFDNVYLCNGDRHWQYVTHFENTNLWEFSCGPGSNSHAGGWKKDDVRPEHKFLRVKGGFLKVNVSDQDDVSKIKFSHCDVDGNVVHTEVFTK